MLCIDPYSLLTNYVFIMHAFLILHVVRVSNKLVNWKNTV